MSPSQEAPGKRERRVKWIHVNIYNDEGSRTKRRMHRTGNISISLCTQKKMERKA